MRRLAESQSEFVDRELTRLNGLVDRLAVQPVQPIALDVAGEAIDIESFQAEKERTRLQAVPVAPPSIVYARGDLPKGRNGQVYAVRQSPGNPMELTTIVRFPVGTKYKVNLRFNVTGKAGTTIGIFIVTSDSTPIEVAGRSVWFGGYIRVVATKRRPRSGDRVQRQ